MKQHRFPYLVPAASLEVSTLFGKVVFPAPAEEAGREVMVTGIVNARSVTCSPRGMSL